MRHVPSGHVRYLLPDVAPWDTSSGVAIVVASLPTTLPVASGHVRYLLPDVASWDMTPSPAVEA